MQNALKSKEQNTLKEVVIIDESVVGCVVDGRLCWTLLWIETLARSPPFKEEVVVRRACSA